MPQSPKEGRAGLPHNPGVRELVDGKRRFSSPPNPLAAQSGFRGWHERGYLPHRDEPGLIQSVTFRLADSFPASLRSEWQAYLELEHDADKRRALELYLDRGRGACHLRRPEIAGLVELTLRCFHGSRYHLLAWVVMPNHVHVLFEVGTASLSDTIGGWKRYSAREANRILGLTGPFWAPDYWDTYARNATHRLALRHYIEANPVKAGIAREREAWPWSSARFRDKYGKLDL